VISVEYLRALRSNIACRDFVFYRLYNFDN
jgi:hypothetical protein